MSKSTNLLEKSAIHKLQFLTDEEAVIFCGFDSVKELMAFYALAPCKRDAKGRWYRPSMEAALLIYSEITNDE